MSDREGSGSASPTAPGDRQGQVPPGVPWPPPKTTGLAIASLVCGALGFFTVGVTGIVGLILGAIGLSDIRRSLGRRGGEGVAVAGIIVSVLSLLFVVALFAFAWTRYTTALRGMAPIPIGTRVRTPSARSECKANLHNLALGIAMYSIDNSGLPPDLDTLYPDYVDTLDTFDCPGNGSTVVPYPGIEAAGDYEYVGSFSAEVPGGVIIALDKPGNHSGGRNALFKDAHVEFIEDSDLPARLQESLDLVREADWDKYSEERKAEIEAFYMP